MEPRAGQRRSGPARDGARGRKRGDRLTEAVAAHRQGALDAAAAIYRRILTAEPNHPDALHLLGLVRHQRGEQEGAIALIERALRVSPTNAAYANSLGLALLALGRPDDAEAALGRALACDPRLAEAHNNLGNARLRRGDANGAADAYRQAIAVRPDYAEAHANLAAALRHAGDLPAARTAIEQALALRPGYAGALSTLGLIRHEQGDYTEALAAYDQALALEPAHATARANRATLLLLLGRMEEGWREYEWRWRVEGFTTPRRDFARPAWEGEPLAGRTILIHAEQGLGSAIQFVRYVPMVADRGGRVVLECQPPLIRLFASLMQGASGDAGLAAIVRKGDPLPAFDVHVPLMSLPRLFSTTLQSIPRPVPYLAIDPELGAQWRRRLATLPKPRIGVVWAGNPNHANDRNRSMPARALLPLLSLPGLSFVDLQVGSGLQGRTELGDMAPRPPGGDIADFADTAAILAELDLVISVDTAVAHLAGALARPAWLLLPFVGEWRWLRERTDSPWYPTMRLFRQTHPGDWTGVIAAVGDTLRAQRW
jgi:tetratricopeptide (TPR) repeat protein